MYDCIIVGAGLSGGIIARKLAEELEKKVLIIERRNHIAGNVYDEKGDYGILVQKYGPHIFHTNNEEVYEYINRFDNWDDYKLKCEVVMNGKNTPSPFNYKTIDTFYNKETANLIKKNIEKEYPCQDKATIVELLDSKNNVIKDYANMLFKNDYSLYTAKQWGISPSEIDISVLKRVPIRFDYKDMYFDDKYECIPKKGYTAFFESLLDHNNISIITGQNALDQIKVDLTNGRLTFDENICEIPVVFTGAIDELLNYKYGKLPYRSLLFKYETLHIESFQSAPVVAYPQVDDYTRITEYTKLPYQDGQGNTIIAYEYPLQYSQEENVEPYYPIINEQNNNAYEKYSYALKKIKNLFLCGRLADYKYYNMDNVIERAFSVYEEIKQYI